MLSSRLGGKFDSQAMNLIKKIGLKGIHPNLLTIIGLIFNLIAAILISISYWKIGGLAILFAGLFDLLDGAVARQKKMASHFGALLDSTLDRASDLFILFGILIYYSIANLTSMVVLTCGVILGSVLIPYIRAKAEIIMKKCDVGILERPERIILLAIGALTGWMKPILWIILILSFVTVIQRINASYKFFKKKDNLDKKMD